MTCWFEAAAVRNFGVYSPEMRRRLALFKKAFGKKLFMHDQFGTLYTREVHIKCTLSVHFHL